MNDENSKAMVGKEQEFNPNNKGKSSKGTKGHKKGQGRHNGKGKGRSGEVRRGVTYNDLSWYTKNQTITEAFTKIPFNYIVGNKPVGMRSAGKNVMLPSVASYGVDWVVDQKNTGLTGTQQRDILNEVATIIYTNMRRHNAGATNDIEYVDVLTSNLLAGIDILANIVYCSRTFKIANSFSWKNRMIPRELFGHMGLDYDDFVMYQSEYRGSLNTLIAEARTIKVLNNYPFINAILAQFENIFKDSDTSTGREQLILPCKWFHHIYDSKGTSTNPGGRVRLMTENDMYPGVGTDSIVTTMPKLVGYKPESEAYAWPQRFATGVSFRTWLRILSTQINALITDSDFNLIQADIEKAFGEQGSYLVADTVTSDSTIEPVYSGEFNTVFHNGVFLPTPDTLDRTFSAEEGMQVLSPNQYVNTVYQTHDDAAGTVRMASHWHFFPYAAANPPTQYQVLHGLCDSDEDDPSADNVIAMTRYKAIYTGVAKADLPAEFAPASGITAAYALEREVSSNFVVFGGFVTYTYFGANSQVGFGTRRSWNNMNVLNAGYIDQLPLVGFRNRPNTWAIYQAATGSISEGVALATDFNNIRCLTIDELFHLNEGCFLSLWSLPELASI